MKSFPSTLNRGGSNLQATNVPSSIKDTLKASWKAAVTQGKAAITSNINLDTEGIRYSEEADIKSLLERSNVTDHASNVFMTHKSEGNNTNYEDPLHLPLNAINVMNKYKAVVYRGPIENTHIPMKDGDSEKAQYLQTSVDGVTGSLFNPYYGMLYKGPTNSTPLLTGDDRVIYKGTDDCSIATLVNLSNDTSRNAELGHARYKYADFMYCKHLGKISNNHLITLRRFTVPVGDNIFLESTLHDPDNMYNMPGDVGRMVTWFGTEDNKLEDILHYDFSASWKQMKGEYGMYDSEEARNAEGAGAQNLFSKIMMLTNPSYYDSIAKGSNPSMQLPFSSTTIDAGPYQSNQAVLGAHYDKNKVYEPRNTIRENHIYEGELNFNHEFNLVFSYKLRAYDNINPKAAFLDLLSNVLVTTYRRGRFWGGENVILGVQPNTAGWNMMQQLQQNITEKGSTFINTMLNSSDFNGAFASLLGSISKAYNGVSAFDWNSFAKEMMSNAKDVAQKAIEAGLGLIQNKLGRPVVYTMNSIVTGANTGLWHVTIGNPRNPIAAFGNLIITKTDIQQFGPLGVDDFPSELKVTVTLKHAKPRDAFDIQRMYTKGLTGVYVSLNSVTNMSDIYKLKGGKKMDMQKEGLNQPIIDSTNYMGDWVAERISSNRKELS